MKWAEISTEEKNQLIHEKVMGQERESGLCISRHALSIACAECNAKWEPDDTHERPYIHNKGVPPYTTSMDAAWPIIQKMAARHNEHTEFLDEPFAQFTDELLPNWAGDCPAYQCMATEVARWTPEKICLAALKACGEDIE